MSSDRLFPHPLRRKRLSYLEKAFDNSEEYSRLLGPILKVYSSHAAFLCTNCDVTGSIIWSFCSSQSHGATKKGING